jgi:predicted component of type VI protein secretion system
MQFKQFVLAVSLTGLIACGASAPVAPEPQPEPVTATSEVSGQVNAWPQGRTGTLRAVVSRLDSTSKFVYVVLAQGSVDAKGKLALKLAKAPEAMFLKPFEVCGIKTAVNALEVDLFDVAETGFETDGSKFVALLVQENSTARATRVYSDRNLEVDGACLDGGVSAKLSLKKGWNLVLKSFAQPGAAVYSSATGVGLPFEFKLQVGPGWKN